MYLISFPVTQNQPMKKKLSQPLLIKKYPEHYIIDQIASLAKLNDQKISNESLGEIYYLDYSEPLIL